MHKKGKLNRIVLVLLSLFVVILGYGILLRAIPYHTERLAVRDKSGHGSDQFPYWNVDQYISIIPALVYNRLGQAFPQIGSKAHNRIRSFRICHDELADGIKMMPPVLPERTI